MSHYDDAERLLARSPSAPAALVHAVLAVADALDPANTVAASVTPEPWAQELRQQVAQRREESLDQAAHERDAARARARDLQRELDDARVAVTHVRRELDDACRVRDEWQTRSRELRNERDALRAAISRAARLLVDRVDPANTVAASSPSAHPYVKLGPEDK